jgi:hypothetical protein
MEKLDSRSKRWPWIEALLLASLVAAVLSFGGDVVRTSYHGYLHTTVGEAVLRDGLQPENPYHAGTALRYYTLYPALGVLLGRLGFGPIWGFALLNILAAILFPLALDAFGRAAKLSFHARRACFWTTVLGFNALGWVGWAYAPPSADSLVPVFAFQSMTFAQFDWGWDARLQGFLPKFLNVSSFALALPLALWSMALGWRNSVASAKVVVATALAMAINPLAGGFAACCLMGWHANALWRGGGRQRWQWPVIGVVSAVLAVPFLLPLFQAAPEAESLTGAVRFQHSGWINFVGPMALLLIPGIVGLRLAKPSLSWKWWWAFLVALWVLVFTHLPWGNEYKFARVAGILWALPVGVWLAEFWQRGGIQRWLPISFGVVASASLYWIVAAYLHWGTATAPVLVVEEGRLVVSDSLQKDRFPSAIAAAERSARRDAVLWMHLNHPGTRAGQGVVQGNSLAPVLHHALFVDRPQIHNDRLADLAQRLQLSSDFWNGAAMGAEPDFEAKVLQSARQILPERPFLILNHDSVPRVSTALQNAGAERVANENGFSLWLLDPLQGSGEK